MNPTLLAALLGLSAPALRGADAPPATGAGRCPPDANVGGRPT